MSDNVIGLFGGNPEGERNEVNQPLVDLLEDILDSAKNGEVRAMSLTWVTGSNHLNMAGNRSWTCETTNEVGQLIALASCNSMEQTATLLDSSEDG